MDTDRSRADVAAALGRLTDHSGSSRWAQHGRHLMAAVTFSVTGRPGVGVSTVGRALSGAGIAVGADDGDVRVRVLAEVAKPEDHAALCSAAGPTVVVLAKADLVGIDGPAEPGPRAVPLRALLAVAGLDPAVIDDAMLGALRTLTTVPADLSSVDAFIAGAHVIPVDLRQRLLERLDLFGIARAVLELRAAPDLGPAALRRVLRNASGIDAVLRELDAAVAEVRYRRLLAVTTELEALAAADPDVAALLRDEGILSARMTAATAVLRAAGLRVGEPGPAEALRWQTYGGGPVTALHLACAADLTRASLRRVAAR